MGTERSTHMQSIEDGPLSAHSPRGPLIGCGLASIRIPGTAKEALRATSPDLLEVIIADASIMGSCPITVIRVLGEATLGSRFLVLGDAATSASSGSRTRSVSAGPRQGFFQLPRSV